MLLFADMPVVNELLRSISPPIVVLPSIVVVNELSNKIEVLRIGLPNADQLVMIPGAKAAPTCNSGVSD